MNTLHVWQDTAVIPYAEIQIVCIQECIRISGFCSYPCNDFDLSKAIISKRRNPMLADVFEDLVTWNAKEAVSRRS